MNYICSWLCADEPGEESVFFQTGELSSSQTHQNIYWRCLIVFYVTSRRFNKNERHVLFTNVKQLPKVDGERIGFLLEKLGVEVIFTDFKYKTPKGYYGAFQNQFYEFSILEYISNNNNGNDDLYLVLDSDCIFIKPAADLFQEASKEGFISFEDEVKPDYIINGLSRNNLKDLYQELLQKEIQEIPSYHLGEFMLSSVGNIKKFFSDFKDLWPQLLERNKAGKQKFNEEAHTLSYLYYKNGFRAHPGNTFMRRIWTNPLFYREVRSTDVDLAIWHLPAEKTFGIYKLYEYFMFHSKNFAFDIEDDQFNELVQKTVGIPHLPLKMKIEYYTVSYYKAIKKRLKRLTLAQRLFV
ncbi:hypothetical protein [Segetibacter aerophilus]|uniref:Nucleotide-diphospho-sugar transferase domain-containing protein n=1 Tax=Segetibacter aerophilus TaxID=670293 RepID=A0A512BIE8_9BACT|nr:hypothetical protein [Segetibacter aerophilus]GEO11746.1 hypothetical protein SAE01_42420 [Segetibacter aerophilus]